MMSNSPIPFRTTYRQAFEPPSPTQSATFGMTTTWRPRTRVNAPGGFTDIRETAEPHRSRVVAKLASSSSTPALLSSGARGSVFGLAQSPSHGVLHMPALGKKPSLQSSGGRSSDEQNLRMWELEVRRYDRPILPAVASPAQDPVTMYVLLKNGKMRGRLADNTAMSPPRMPRLW